MNSLHETEAVTPPGLLPPSGVVSNFSNPYSDEDAIITTLALCLTASTLLVWTRLYTKLFISKHVEWEDCKILQSNHCFLAYKRANVALDTSLISWVWIPYAVVRGFLITSSLV